MVELDCNTEHKKAAIGEGTKTSRPPLTIFRLPPFLLVSLESGDNVFNQVTVGLEHWVIRIPGITGETFLLILEKQNMQDTASMSFLSDYLEHLSLLPLRKAVYFCINCPAANTFA